MQLTPLKIKEYGRYFLIPGSDVEAQIYPERIYLKRLDQPNSIVIYQMKIEGPVKNFVVEIDIKKKRFSVCMQTKKGHIAYKIQAENNTISVVLKKSPVGYLILNETILQKKETLVLCQAHTAETSCQTQLFLGSMKKKWANQVREEMHLLTLLPWLFALLETVPICQEKARLSNEGLQLLKDRRTIVPFFTQLFHSELQDFFIPRSHPFVFDGSMPLFENQHQQLAKLHLIRESILNLFIQVDKNRVILMPFVPREFHQGKVIGYQQKGYLISFTFSKGMLYNLEIQLETQVELTILFPKEIRRFRANSKEKKKLEGNQLQIQASDSRHWFVDHFER